MEKSLDYYYLKQLEQGSQDAFDALYLHYYPKLKGFMLSFIKDEEIAKDLSQDIFMKIWINKGTISSISNFSSYLFTCAKNAIYNYYQHNLIKEKYISTLQGLPDYADFMEENIFVNELNELITFAVANMPRKRREIFIMSREKGMSNQEIAEKLNISKRTIENQITLALAMLRKVVISAKTLLI